MKDLLPKIDSRDGEFHNGNPATGEQGTRITAEWLNDVQAHLRDTSAELKHLLFQVGMSPIPRKTTQIYEAIIAVIDANRRNAGISSKGEVQLTNELNNDSDNLGLTAKAGKTLKALIDSLTRNQNNYIQNSKKSDAIDSDSSDDVATSKAVKTAYDKTVSLEATLFEFAKAIFAGDLDEIKKLAKSIDEKAGEMPLGIKYDFTTSNAWWICFGPLFGGLIIQGGIGSETQGSNTFFNFPISFKKYCLGGACGCLITVGIHYEQYNAWFRFNGTSQFQIGLHNDYNGTVKSLYWYAIGV